MLSHGLRANRQWWMSVAPPELSKLFVPLLCCVQPSSIILKCPNISVMCLLPFVPSSCTGHRNYFFGVCTHSQTEINIINPLQQLVRFSRQYMLFSHTVPYKLISFFGESLSRIIQMVRVHCQQSQFSTFA